MNALSASWPKALARRRRRNIRVDANPVLATNTRYLQWVELADNAAESNPFYHPALLLPALELLAQDAHAQVLEARDEGELIGLLPIEARTRHGRFPVQHISNFTHLHCFFGAPIMRKGREERAWELLLGQMDALPHAGPFLHLMGQNPEGPTAIALHRVCTATGRALSPMNGYARALLASDLSGEAYLEANMRGKKRKELRRLANRLQDLGEVQHRVLSDTDDLASWCNDFMRLEASGWKGQSNSAMTCHANEAEWFSTACRNAHEAGMLQIVRIDVDAKPIAMLVNFLHLDGSFSFKIAIDESFGRYSPGVLIELDNLHAILTNPAIGWMDSCAAPDHPMIDSIWAERRQITQYRVALRGAGFAKIMRPARYHIVGLSQSLLQVLKGSHSQKPASRKDEDNED